MTSATKPSRYGYVGSWQKDREEDSDFVRMGVRMYDPMLLRFSSADPVEGGDLNSYSYAGQGPIDNYDLDGTHCGGRGYNRYKWTGKKWKHQHDHRYCGVGRWVKRNFVGAMAVLAGAGLIAAGAVCTVAAAREDTSASCR